MTQQKHKHLKHQRGTRKQKGKDSYLIHKFLQCQKTRFFQYAEAWKLLADGSGGSALSTRKWQPGQETAATSTDQTGSSCLGWLMSEDIYCHWVGCCIPQGTAAFPIGQLHLNGQQTHIEAVMAEKRMQWQWQPNPFPPWELSLCDLLYCSNSMYRKKKQF